MTRQRVVELKNGETLSVIDERKFLEDAIYDYLGVDAYQIFDDYVDNLFEQIDDLNKEIEEWKQEVTIWENGGHDE